MSQSVPSPVIDYPCSDGQPMGESDLHIARMSYVLDTLKWHFGKRTRDGVYVSANSFLYYERGNPRAVVAPDVGVPGHLRDSYLLWKEPKGPDFVLEVTSASTRREDERRKRGVYSALGVREYFLYDPRGEYLAPPLQGFRLREGEYRALPAAVTVPSGAAFSVQSNVLGLDFRDEREERMLRLHDPVAWAGPPHLRGIRTGSRSRGGRAPGGSRCPAGGGSPHRQAGSPSPALRAPLRRATEPKALNTAMGRRRHGVARKEPESSMSEVGELGAVLLYRAAAKGLLPVSWFRHVDPARVPRAKRHGRLHLEIVSHCWRYEHFLTYQLSSLVLHRSTRLETTVTVYHCPEDEPTLRVLRFFGDMEVPEITWNWQPLPKEKLFRRAIGRNLAAMSTKADWVWFTDADIVFQEGCLDTLAELLQGKDDALVFPETTVGTALLPEDDPLLRRGREGPALLSIPPGAFPFRCGPADRAKGPYQITHGEIARACGYCDSLRAFQKPAPRWRKAYEDAVFRWLIGTPGTPIRLPGVCQIRHLAKGRYAGSGFSSAVRTFLRRNQDRRRLASRD